MRLVHSVTDKETSLEMGRLSQGLHALGTVEGKSWERRYISEVTFRLVPVLGLPSCSTLESPCLENCTKLRKIKLHSDLVHRSFTTEYLGPVGDGG